jgi:hypothetical protein
MCPRPCRAKQKETRDRFTLHEYDSPNDQLRHQTHSPRGSWPLKTSLGVRVLSKKGDIKRLSKHKAIGKEGKEGKEKDTNNRK